MLFIAIVIGMRLFYSKPSKTAVSKVEPSKLNELTPQRQFGREKQQIDQVDLLRQERLLQRDKENQMTDHQAKQMVDKWIQKDFRLSDALITIGIVLIIGGIASSLITKLTNKD